MGVHFLMLVLKRNLTFFSNGAHELYGALGIYYILMLLLSKQPKKKKKACLDKWEPTVFLLPPLTDSMFPNNMTLTKGDKALRIHSIENQPKCIWGEARRKTTILWKGNVSQGLSVFYPAIQETQEETKL